MRSSGGTSVLPARPRRAAVINHVLDRRIDEQMGRTRGRPLPTGRLTETRALIFAAILGVTAMSILRPQGQSADRRADLLLAHRLCGGLHRVAEARDLAEHRHRRRRWSGAAGARLGGSDGPCRSECAAAVSHYFRLDPAALLGARDRAPRRIRSRRHPDAAGDTRRRVHAPARAALHGAARASSP